MSDKPSYLGLLNAVAIAEGRRTPTSTAWAEVTPSADVRSVLLTVAAREGEHADELRQAHQRARVRGAPQGGRLGRQGDRDRDVRLQ